MSITTTRIECAMTDCHTNIAVSVENRAASSHQLKMKIARRSAGGNIATSASTSACMRQRMQAAAPKKTNQPKAMTATSKVHEAGCGKR
jgi:hypothetical protein